MEPVVKHLANKRITIIGLGSIGSVLALNLAKSGVGGFFLWDYDVVEPKNIPRHVANITHNYYRKAEVMAAEIKKHNPMALAIPISSDPLSLEPRTRQIFEKNAQDSDLIIFAGISERDERLISEVVFPLKKPLLYVSTNYAASLGQIYRVYPGETPCWECIRTYRDHDERIFPRIDEQDQMQRVHYENDNWPGLGVDTGSIAIAATRFALQTLCKDMAEQNRVPITLKDVPYDFFIWSNVKNEKYEYGVTAFKAERIEGCPLCGRF